MTRRLDSIRASLLRLEHVLDEAHLRAEVLLLLDVGEASFHHPVVDVALALLPLLLVVARVDQPKISGIVGVDEGISS